MAGMSSRAEVAPPAPALPTREEIANAYALINRLVRRTPVVDVALPDGRPVTLKLELLQHTGSFKPRGAFTTVLAAPEAPHTLVAASGGNHGLAVAHVGRTLGIPARVFVPETTPAAKVARLRALGAEVTLAGQVYADALIASASAAAAPGAMTLHAYDAPGTVTGQGTVGLELDEQCDPTTVLVAVGGGGLISGIATWFAGTDTQVVAVEPENCDALAAALDAGRPVATRPSGVAVDSLGASTIGSICFQVAHTTGMPIVRITDDDIIAARTWLWRELRVAAEPGGAAALAALLSGAWEPDEGERVAVVVCGANADPSDLPLD
jgi:threonine dehydratase